MNMFSALRAAVSKIPKGKVSTYGEVAKAAGFPGAARQAAWALHGAGLGLPWHRVVGAGGHIRLSGESAFEQQMRLRNEGVAFQGKRVDMKMHCYEFPVRKHASKRAKKKKSR
ncbi:MAG TPA: MGMT family protein [Terriglobales bacterium]|nr:MGMT family protein [Terriglobales bacterium]